jgi:hypothetical protein
MKAADDFGRSAFFAAAIFAATPEEDALICMTIVSYTRADLRGELQGRHSVGHTRESAWNAAMKNSGAEG